MCTAALAARVGVVLHRGDPDPVDRADVDHPGRVVRASPRREAAAGTAGSGRNALDVDVPDLVEAGSGILLQRRAPGRPGIVDQHVQPGLPGRDGLEQRSTPSSVDRSAGTAAQPSSAAVFSSSAALREEMYTCAPASTNPAAIIRPIPREPPVTTTVLPSTENRVMFCSMPYPRLLRPYRPVGSATSKDEHYLCRGELKKYIARRNKSETIFHLSLTSRFSMVCLRLQRFTDAKVGRTMTRVGARLAALGLTLLLAAFPAAQAQAAQRARTERQVPRAEQSQAVRQAQTEQAQAGQVRTSGSEPWGRRGPRGIPSGQEDRPAGCDAVRGLDEPVPGRPTGLVLDPPVDVRVSHGPRLQDPEAEPRPGRVVGDLGRQADLDLQDPPTPSGRTASPSPRRTPRGPSTRS